MTFRVYIKEMPLNDKFLNTMTIAPNFIYIVYKHLSVLK